MASAWAATAAPPWGDDYPPPFAFAGGAIDRVVVDVSGEPYVDHEKEVHAWLARD